MKRTYHFVEPSGVSICATASGDTVALPLFAGILKHPTAAQLAELVRDPAVAVKYTHEALRKAPWSALRHFPRSWLVECLPHARLPEGRRKALELMLGA
jgi:hypothetical protein